MPDYPGNNISGWMGADELQWLYEQAAQASEVVEIGSWMGRSTHALLSGCAGPVHAVDHFKGSLSELHTVHAYALNHDIYRDFMANVGHFSNLIVHRMDSAEAAMLFEPRSVDMVWLDGDHEYSFIKQDIKLWLPVARQILCGHDRTQQGVPQALAESFKTYNAGPGCIWWIDVNNANNILL